MKNFEYAQPRDETDLLSMLSPVPGHTELLAGGTDLVGLMKSMVVTPERIVNIADMESMRQLEADEFGHLWVGAMVRLEDFLLSAVTDPYPAVNQAIQGINSMQVRSQSTLAGELFQRPHCWFFRQGHGLLAQSGRMAIEGDNRFHAILGNRGVAKFVSPSRLAPALISLGARCRVIGPKEGDERIVPLEQLYQTPARQGQREHAFLPNQVVTHVILPPDDGRLSAVYEVRHGEGPDAPLAAAAATLEVLGGIVQQARVVMGQVAPIPWISAQASRSIQGKVVSESTAHVAGAEAVASARSLSHNEYKIQLAQVSVTRAILRAVGLQTGGF